MLGKRVRFEENKNDHPPQKRRAYGMSLVFVLSDKELSKDSPNQESFKDELTDYSKCCIYGFYLPKGEDFTLHFTKPRLNVLNMFSIGSQIVISQFPASQKPIQFHVVEDVQGDIEFWGKVFHSVLTRIISNYEFAIPITNRELLDSCKDLWKTFISLQEKGNERLFSNCVQGLMLENTQPIFEYYPYNIYCWITVLSLASYPQSPNVTWRDETNFAVFQLILKSCKISLIHPGFVRMIIDSLNIFTGFTIPNGFSAEQQISVWSEMEYVNLIKSKSKQLSQLKLPDASIWQEILLNLCPATAISINTLCSLCQGYSEKIKFNVFDIVEFMLEELLVSNQIEQLLSLGNWKSIWITFLVKYAAKTCCSGFFINAFESTFKFKCITNDDIIGLIQRLLLLSLRNQKNANERQFLPKIWKLIKDNILYFEFMEPIDESFTDQVISPLLSKLFHKSSNDISHCLSMSFLLTTIPNENPSLIVISKLKDIVFHLCTINEQSFNSFIRSDTIDNLSISIRLYLAESLFNLLEDPKGFNSDYFKRLGLLNGQNQPCNDFCKKFLDKCIELFRLLKMNISLASCIHSQFIHILYKYNEPTISSFVGTILSKINNWEISIEQFELFANPINPSHQELNILLKNEFCSQELFDKIDECRELVRKYKNICYVRENLLNENITKSSGTLLDIQNIVFDSPLIFSEIYNLPYFVLLQNWFKYEYNGNTDREAENLLNNIQMKIEELIKFDYNQPSIPFRLIYELSYKFKVYQSPQSLISMIKSVTNRDITIPTAIQRITFCYQSRILLNNVEEFYSFLRRVIHCSSKFSYFDDYFNDTSLPILEPSVAESLEWLYKYRNELQLLQNQPGAVQNFFDYLASCFPLCHEESEYITSVNSLLSSPQIKEKLISIKEYLLTKQIHNEVDKDSHEIIINDRESLMKFNAIQLNSNLTFGDIDSIIDYWPEIAGRKVSLNNITDHFNEIKAWKVSIDSKIPSNQPYCLFTIPQLTLLEQLYNSRKDKFLNILETIIPLPNNSNIRFNCEFLQCLSSVIPKFNNTENNEPIYISCSLYPIAFHEILMLFSKKPHRSQLIICTPELTWHELRACLHRMYIPNLELIYLIYPEILSKSVFKSLQNFIDKHTQCKVIRCKLHILTTNEKYKEFERFPLQLIPFPTKQNINFTSKIPIKVYSSKVNGIGKSEIIYSKQNCVGIPLVITNYENPESIINNITQIQDFYFGDNYLHMYVYPSNPENELQANIMLLNLLLYNTVFTTGTIFSFLPNQRNNLCKIIELQYCKNNPSILKVFNHQSIDNPSELILPSRKNTPLHWLFSNYGGKNFTENNIKEFINTKFITTNFRELQRLLTVTEAVFKHQNNIEPDKWFIYCKSIATMKHTIEWNNWKEIVPYYLEDISTQPYFIQGSNEVVRLFILRDRVRSGLSSLICGGFNVGKNWTVKALSIWMKIPEIKQLRITFHSNLTEDNLLSILKQSDVKWIIFDEIQNAPHLYPLLCDIILQRRLKEIELSNEIVFFALYDILPNSSNPEIVLPILKDYFVHFGLVQFNDYKQVAETFKMNNTVFSCMNRLHYFLKDSHNILNPRLNRYFKRFMDILIQSNDSPIINPFYELGKIIHSIDKIDIEPILIIVSSFLAFGSCLKSIDTRLQIWQELSKVINRDEVDMYNDFNSIIKEFIGIFEKQHVLPKHIVPHQILLENLLLLSACISCNIPLCIIGESGSSKSLSVNIIQDYYHKTNQNIVFLKFSGKNRFDYTLLDKIFSLTKLNSLYHQVLIFDNISPNQVKMLNQYISDVDFNFLSFGIIVIMNEEPNNDYDVRRFLISRTSPVTNDILSQITNSSELIEEYNSLPNEEKNIRRFYTVLKSSYQFPQEKLSNLFNYHVAPTKIEGLLEPFLRTDSRLIYLSIISLDIGNITLPNNVEIIDCNIIDKEENSINDGLFKVFTAMTKEKLLIIKNIKHNSSILSALYDFIENNETQEETSLITPTTNYNSNLLTIPVHPNFRCILHFEPEQWNLLHIHTKSKLQGIFLGGNTSSLQTEIENWMKNISLSNTMSISEYLFFHKQEELSFNQIICGYYQSLIQNICNYAERNKKSISNIEVFIQQILYLRMPISSFLAIFTSKLDLKYSEKDYLFKNFLYKRSLMNFLRYMIFQESSDECFNVLNRKYSSVIFSFSSVDTIYSATTDIMKQLNQEQIPIVLIDNPNSYLQIIDSIDSIIGIVQLSSSLNLESFINKRIGKKTIILISIQSIKESSDIIEYPELLEWNQLSIDTIDTNRATMPQNFITQQCIDFINNALPKTFKSWIKQSLPKITENINMDNNTSKLYQLLFDSIAIQERAKLFLQNCNQQYNWMFEISRTEELNILPFYEAKQKFIIQYLIHILPQFIEQLEKKLFQNICPLSNFIIKSTEEQENLLSSVL